MKNAKKNLLKSREWLNDYTVKEIAWDLQRLENRPSQEKSTGLYRLNVRG